MGFTKALVVDFREVVITELLVRETQADGTLTKEQAEEAIKARRDIRHVCAPALKLAFQGLVWNQQVKSEGGRPERFRLTKAGLAVARDAEAALKLRNDVRERLSTPPPFPATPAIGG